MSVAIECPISATGPRHPVSASPAPITRRVSAIRRAVVPSSASTSPPIGTGLRPCPSKSNASAR